MELSDRLARAEGRGVELDGKLVVAMFEHPVGQGDRVRIVWRASVAAPVQGIRVAVAGGSLRLDGKTWRDVVLWRDTAPDETVFEVVARRGGALQVWNCWRVEAQGAGQGPPRRGFMQAWVGNAAMHVERSSETAWTARCNSRPVITFEDAVFDIVIEAHGTLGR